MDQVQLPVIVGFCVSMIFQVLKKWQWLECSDATVKQVTAAVLSAVTVFGASQWHFDMGTVMQAVGAAIMALATHKALLQKSLSASLSDM